MQIFAVICQVFTPIPACSCHYPGKQADQTGPALTISSAQIDDNHNLSTTLDIIRHFYRAACCLPGLYR